MDKNSIVYDIVYTPMNTDLINNAKKNGATIIYGYEMLLSQASHAFEIWHGVKAPYEDEDVHAWDSSGNPIPIIDE